MNAASTSLSQTNANRPGALFVARFNARQQHKRGPAITGSANGITPDDDRRTICAVRDLNLPLEQQVRPVSDVLDPLSVTGLAALRRTTWRANTAGKPRFVCACCNEPVRLRQTPAGPGVPRDGRGAHFAHAARKGSPPCDWRTAPVVRSIGANQYNGLQEGPLHRRRKAQLTECLRRDARFSSVRVEKQIRADGGRCQPDVSAVLDGRTIAFDIQLAVLPLSTIMQRETFYAAHDIHHVVLTDGDSTERLGRLAFGDIHLAAGGRIFAIDDAIVAASLRDGQLQLLELSLLPRLRPLLRLDNVWERRPVGLAAIMQAPAQRQIAGEARYRETLRGQAKASFGRLRERLRLAAAQDPDLDPVRGAYAEIAAQVQAPSYSQSTSDGLGLAFAWLAQAESCCRATAPHRSTALRALEQRTMALLAHPKARSWVSLLMLSTELLAPVRDAQTPVVEARLAQLRQKRTPLHLMHQHRDMLVLLYPWLGFRLLAHPPVNRRHLH